jgi:voltage-gated potassium channel Kch
MSATPKKVRLSDRLRYAFDNSMASGPAALIGWLGVLSLAVILLAAFILTVGRIRPEEGEDLGFFEAAWQSLMRTLDAGTMGGDTGWTFRFVMLAVTLGGVFIVAILIGVLTSGIESKLDELRKGRSFVLENGHTLILGWSPNIFTIISQLVLANANQRNPRIVILADKDKVEMEDEIRAKVGSTGRTRVICRTGSPIDHYDLEIVNPHTAKSIIIVSPETEDADSHVIKPILALINNPHRRPEPYRIVAEIRDPKNLEVARMVGQNEVQLVLSDDVISRITVQTCRQSGMSVVYAELLDFEGNEIYFHEELGLVGKTFGEAMMAYEDSTIIGLQYADSRLQLIPPVETHLGAGDKVVAIAEDDDRVRLSGITGMQIDGQIDRDAIRNAPPASLTPERTLILGWNRRGPLIINELDRYVPPGSEVRVVADTAEAEAEITRLCPGVQNQQCGFQHGDTTDRRTLDELDVPTYHHVIVLGYTDNLGSQEADARTLVTLLHLRNIVETSGRDVSIVSEMVDIRNRELAEVTRADDFIVSDRLISLMLTQLSENGSLGAVFADIFDPEGSEIYVRPAADYVALDRPIRFYTVVESARLRGEVAIGYRRQALAGDADRAYGVFVNPRKSDKVTFGAADRIIVLAQS